MKIRWTQDSVRLRITPSEFQALLNGAPVQEALQWSVEGAWSVLLGAGHGDTQMRFAGGTLSVLLASNDLERLADPETEGVYFQNSQGVRYYVEKDFPCVHPRASEAQEPATETFSPPADFSERKLS